MLLRATYDFNIYCGGEDVVKGTLGVRVVNQLAATIQEYKSPYASIGFSSASILDYVMLGTAMSNRKKFPVVNVKFRKEKCISRESNTGFMFVKWHDTKEVIVVSNCHSSDIITVDKKLKDDQKINIPCPEIIKFYRQIMEEVDQADQMAGCREHKKEKRTKTIYEKCQIPLCVDCFASYHK
ncbi:hypothetical protein ANTPLA_LOCUS712 [Anthophora plagiata]